MKISGISAKYCGDDGINYSDYVTELLLLLFIKMEYKNTEAGLLNKHKFPDGCRWPDLSSKSGLNLLNDYRRILLGLSTGKNADGNTVVSDQLIFTMRLNLVIKESGLGENNKCAGSQAPAWEPRRRSSSFARLEARASSAEFPSWSLETSKAPNYLGLEGLIEVVRA